MNTASARKNGGFGYKAVIVRANGSTYQPLRKNWKTREEALAYAQKWIDANANAVKPTVVYPAY